MKLIPYGKQDISDQDVKAVIEVLKSDLLTQGPKIEEFENEFANYIGCKYAVSVANGTAALHLSALALGVNKKSKVITTPITFAASANCVRYCGGEVVFADIDPSTALLDINSVRALLEGSPKGTYQGIIPVDFAGHPVDMESYRQLADEFDLWIIEDACHAPGGYFNDSKGVRQYCGNGNFADLAIFSFHPVKHIACGEGGMITTNNKELYEKLLLLRTHGITKRPDLLTENHGGWYYEMVELGYNYRLTDVQAALGISQLMRAEEGITKRRRIAKIYDEAFKENDQIKTLNPTANGGKSVFEYGHAYHLYVILVDERKKMYDYLHNSNILVQVHYIPLHYFPYYRDPLKNKHLLNSGKYYEKCLSLPMYPGLKKEEQELVIEKMLNFERY